ncbi:MAG: hypothetical protein KAW61_03890, partial [candidate division Zixibacteria bacterium]|nr:hypothetical protein [candidate division Zixibacteria bacterium]
HGQTSLTMPPSRNDDSWDTLLTALLHHIFRVDGRRALCLPTSPNEKPRQVVPAWADDIR